MGQRSILIFGLLLLASLSVSAQYHVKVACNPDHNGETNPAWYNNYVVYYTTDNWKHSFVINDLLEWGDPGSEIPEMVTFEPPLIRTMDQATVYAKKFRSAEFVGIYEAQAYRNFLVMDKVCKSRAAKAKAAKEAAPKPECLQKVIY